MASLTKLKRAVCGFAVGLFCLSTPVVAQTGDWPSRPITLIIPFGPGSGADLVGRLINTPLGELLGQPVIIQNMAGAGGSIGAARAAHSAPDGYTVVIGAVDTFGQGPLLRKKQQYDPRADFDPVGLAFIQPLVLITRKNLNLHNLAEFSDYVKKNQAKMQFGSSGVGSAPHLVCSELIRAMNASVIHVSYRGSAEAMQDLMAGQLDFYCALASTAVSQMSAGNVDAVAVLTRERSAVLPDVPTAKEQGYDIGDFYYWMGLFLPKGTPQPIVDKFNKALSAVLDRPDVQKRLKDFATVVAPADRRSPAYLRRFLNDEITFWAKSIKEKGIEPN